MQTKDAQISLYIPAVCSAPLLFTYSSYIQNSKTLSSFCNCQVWILPGQTTQKAGFLIKLFCKWATEWHMHPEKTQISQGICPVWSVFTVHSMVS